MLRQPGEVKLTELLQEWMGACGKSARISTGNEQQKGRRDKQGCKKPKYESVGEYPREIH